MLYKAMEVQARRRCGCTGATHFELHQDAIYLHKQFTQHAIDCASAVTCADCGVTVAVGASAKEPQAEAPAPPGPLAERLTLVEASKYLRENENRVICRAKWEGKFMLYVNIVGVYKYGIPDSPAYQLNVENACADDWQVFDDRDAWEAHRATTMF